MALSFIWAVPVLAAIIAALLIFENLQKFGPVVTISFQSAAGLDPNQTVIRYRGVRVGSVRSIQLSRDLTRVEVKARLSRSAAGLAQEGSVYWIVRPEVGAAGFHALETIVSGPYIEALPGNGPGRVQTRFNGLEEAPILTDGEGKAFILHASFVRSLGPGSPVYYRGLRAGQVQYLELADDSGSVKIHALIKPAFTPLVRANTVWWNAGGINVSWHLLSGVSMTAENLRAVVTGGLAFATPDEPQDVAAPGTVFELHERAESKWLEWAPSIRITNAAVSSASAPAMDLQNLNNNSTPKPQ